MPSWAVILWTACALLMAFCAWKKRRGTWLAASVVVFIAGMVAQAGHTYDPTIETCAPRSLWQAQIRGASRIKPQQRGVQTLRVPVRLLAQSCDGRWRNRGYDVAVTLPFDAETVTRGDVLWMDLTVHPIEPQLNPGALQLSPRIRVHGYTIGQRASGLLAVIDGWRNDVNTTIWKHVPKRTAGLVAALAVGDTYGIDIDQRQRWSDAGVAHLLALSGLHTSLVAAIGLWLGRLICFLMPLWPRVATRLAAIFALLCIWGFVLWSGSTVSVLRAAWMTSAYMLAFLVGRTSTGWTAFGWSGCILLLLDPSAIDDISFLLSFAAVAAILILQPMDAKGFRGELRSLLVLSLSTGMATAPVLAATFGRISLISVMVNLFLIPTASFILTPLCLILGPLSGTWPWVVWVLDRSAWIFDRWVFWWASWPMAIMTVPKLHSAVCVLYLILLCLFWWLLKRAFYMRAVGLSVLMHCILLLGPGFFPPSELELIFPYIGQGDATVVRTPSGHTLVVDAGIGTHDRVLVDMLASLGVRSIDVAVVTHAHPDHFNGFAALLRRFPMRELWWPGGEIPSEFAAILDLAKSRGVVVRTPNHERGPFLYGDVGVRVLHPRSQEGGVYEELGANDNSLVLDLSYGKHHVLLTGDIEAMGEALLLEGEVPSIDLLKVPHHGSRTSSGEALLVRTKPSWAVLSAGVSNQFGHPHTEVVERYGAHGISLLETPTHGACRFLSDGANWHVWAVRPPENSTNILPWHDFRM